MLGVHQKGHVTIRYSAYDFLSDSVMCSETVGLRSWSWVLQFWCCFVKRDLVTLVVIMILNDTASNFSSTIYSFSIMCLEHHYCGDVAFTYS